MMDNELSHRILQEIGQKGPSRQNVMSLEKGMLNINLEIDQKIDDKYYLKFNENCDDYGQVYQHDLDIDYQEILAELKGESIWEDIADEFRIDKQQLTRKVQNYEMKQSMDKSRMEQINSSLQSISEFYVQDQTKMQTLDQPQYCFINRTKDNGMIDNIVFSKTSNKDNTGDISVQQQDPIDYEKYVDELEKQMELEGLVGFDESQETFDSNRQMKKFINYVNYERVEKIKEKKNQEMNKNLLDIYLEQQQDHQKQEQIDREKEIEKKENQLENYRKLQESKNQNIYEKFSKMDNDLNVDDFDRKLDKNKMAITYEFELDDFQKRSILRLEENKNVFVSAHTSAGKTVVAEYAIALSINKKKKVIYTSPIKALSNQKYRELRKKFKDVGIITGDIQVNSESSCLIMTTEILRNMLLKDNNNNEVIKQIEWVIFDEIHYLNDPDRGVVWEETIIMLPKHIKLVMLSATVPNAQEFAEWVGRTRQSLVYLHSTTFRPVPLQHNIYIQGVKDNIMKQTVKFGDQAFSQNVYSDKSREIVDYYKKAMNDKKSKKKELDQMKKERREIAKKTGHFKEKRGEKSFRCQINRINQQKVNKRTEKTNPQNTQQMKEAKAFEQLLQDLKKNNDLPCIVFMFSKAKINQLSQNIMSIDLCSRQQSKQIGAFIDQCLNKKLKKEDIELPQFIMMKKLLVRGIGVHYGDLLPIMKEIVEILFSQSLIKVLLATETFAMGVNMPAKSVVFYQIQKNDGQTYRFLKSNEYIQMSGRAGRRGLDDKGKVIIFFSANPRTGQVQLPPSQDIKTMLDFKGEHLQSQFRIKYGLLLNLLNNNETNDELKHTQLDHIMQNSFLQNQQYAQLPVIALKVQKMSNQINQIQTDIAKYDYSLEAKQEYVNCMDSLLEVSEKIADGVDEIDHKFFNYRLCILMDQNAQFEMGITIQSFVNKKKNDEMTLDVLVEEYRKRTNFQYLKENKPIKFDYGQFKIVKVYGHNVVMTFEDILKLDGSMYRKNISDNQLAKVLGGFLADIKDSNKLNEQIDFIGLLQNCQISGKKGHKNKKDNRKRQQFQLNRVSCKNLFPQLQDYDEQQQIYIQTLVNNQIFKDRDHKIFRLIYEENNMNKEINKLRKEGQVSNNHLLSQFEDKVKVLTELNYIDNEQMPQLKCRLGKELSECNIYVTEMILEGLLEDLNASEAAAFLSCFISCYKKKHTQHQDEMEDKMDEDFGLLSKNLRSSIQKGYKILDKLYDLEVRLKVTDKEYIEYEQEYFNVGHVRIVYEWCQKMDFVQITKLTDSPEGAIVRTIMRLEQLIRSVKTAAKIVGNQQLQNKMEEAQQLIKRDIVFTQSLYLDE